MIRSIMLFIIINILVSCAENKKSSDNVIIEQSDLLSALKTQFENATVYEKYQNVYARKATEGEKVKTYTSDGLETENVAKSSDFVVKNMTESKEEYILSDEKFNSRYELKTENVDDAWSLYKPTGKVKAIKVDNNILDVFSIENSEFYIIAAWDEEMIVKEGDYLVSPLDYTEIYRIAEKEFFETYTNK